jgi:hypothetical protein
MESCLATSFLSRETYNEAPVSSDHTILGRRRKEGTSYNFNVPHETLLHLDELAQPFRQVGRKSACGIFAESQT